MNEADPRVKPNRRLLADAFAEVLHDKGFAVRGTPGAQTACEQIRSARRGAHSADEVLDATSDRT